MPGISAKWNGELRTVNLSQLQDSLNTAFIVEGHRIVFWYDSNGDFAYEVAKLSLPGIQVINMQKEPTLSVKLKLEIEDVVEQYLLYFPSAEPEESKDWLLDIKLYSRCFYADRISIIFNDLGLQQHCPMRIARSPLTVSTLRNTWARLWIRCADRNIGS